MSNVPEKVILRKHLKIHTRSLILVVLSCVVLIISSIYAFLDGMTLSGVEIAIFEFINALPNWLTPFFVLITNIATLGAVVAAGFVAIIGKKRRIGLAILLSGVIAWFVSNILKDVIGRARPNGFIDDAIVRYTDLASGNGFPSGHSAVAAAIAMSLVLILPRRFAPILITLVLLVGVSRVYLGVHLPLDVVGGWAIGIIIGYIVDISLRVESVKNKESR